MFEISSLNITFWMEGLCKAGNDELEKTKNTFILNKT
jgi:hypothetical protein